MKTRMFFFAALAVVTIIMNGCSKSLPDPVLDLPVQHEWNDQTLSVIDSISATTSVEDAQQMIQRSELTENILQYLNIPQAKVQYYILEANGKDTLKVTDSLGTTFAGILSKNQLLVKITDDGHSAMYFVRCMNGMVSEIDLDDQLYIGEEIYVLSKGEGPMHHGATYAEVWDMCVRYDLKLTAYSEDQKGDLHRIREAKSLDDFRTLSTDYPIVRINTLQPGDRLRKNFDNSWDYLK